MQTRYTTTKHPTGITLIETLISLAIFIMVSSAFYLLIQLGLRTLTDDQIRLDAIAIAQSQIESLRNVPYDDVGTIEGIPHGVFASHQTIVQNTISYTVKTEIRYIDDPLDGTIQTIPRDTVNTDYKKARVEVTWENQFLNQPVILITTVVPNGIETTSGGGTIWIEVYSTDATPLSNATIEIINTAVTPAVPLSLQTDTDGRLILPGAPAAIQAYQITVSKNGYSSEQTYSIDEIHNPHPDPNHLTVIESEVTTKTFTIDTVSELRIHLEDYTTHTSLANIPVRIIGKKRIGTDLEGNDIPKYNTTLTTDATGTITLSAMEHDIYTITLQDATLDFAGSSPHIPLVLAPNSSVDLTISAAPHAEQTALITVEDANETVISDAQVHLTHTILLYDQTQNTNNFGQTFFTPLELGTYTIEITKEGFAPYTGTIDVLENTQQIISLITATP